MAMRFAGCEAYLSEVVQPFPSLGVALTVCLSVLVAGNMSAQLQLLVTTSATAHYSPATDLTILAFCRALASFYLPLQ